jgi:hypothetical protein
MLSVPVSPPSGQQRKGRRSRRCTARQTKQACCDPVGAIQQAVCATTYVAVGGTGRNYLDELARWFKRFRGCCLYPRSTVIPVLRIPKLDRDGAGWRETLEGGSLTGTLVWNTVASQQDRKAAAARGKLAIEMPRSRLLCPRREGHARERLNPRRGLLHKPLAPRRWRGHPVAASV